MSGRPKKQAKKEAKLKKSIQPTHEASGKVTRTSYDFKVRLEKIAFKSYETTWADLAKELGVSLSAINQFREKYSREIEDIQRERFMSARPDIERALIGAATGRADEKGKPNVQAIEFFFDRFSHLVPLSQDNSFDIFSGNFWPTPKQVGPLFHWDRSFGESGQDQIVTTSAGRGFGKSKNLVRRAALLAKINRGCYGMVMAPTYKMLSFPVIQYWEMMLNECRIPHKKDKTNHVYTLWGDTPVIFRSYDNIDTSGRGPDLAWVQLDEFREGSKYVLDTIMGAVRDPKARLRQIGIWTTPAGFDHVWDVAANPDSPLVKSGRSVLYTGSSRDNFYLPQSFIDSLENAYDEKVVRQEIYGEFINVTSGRIYYQFDRAEHIGEYPFDPELPIYIGQDFNYHPMCWVVCQVHKGQDNQEEVHVVDELHMDTSSTDDACKELKRRGYGPENKPEEWVQLYPDSSATQKSASSGSRSNVEICKQHGFQTIKYTPANARILERYAAVNGMLRNAKGRIRLRVNKKCQYLIRDLEREIFKEGTNQREDSKDDAKLRGHLSDALGYFINYRYKVTPNTIQ